MIRRDRNKASVILWSVSNETPNNPTRTKFLSDLVAEARKLDGTRLITSAIIGPRANGNEMLQNDPLCDVLDVVGQNEYVGWYDMTPEQADSIHWTLPQKPVLMSEFGAEAKFGNHGPVDQRWTEEQQAYVLEHQFVMLRKIPQLRGTIPWILMDFRSPGRNIPKLQDGYNRKGLISEKGEKKQAFHSLSKGLCGALTWQGRLIESAHFRNDSLQHWTSKNTAAIRCAHSSPPVIEWFMPDLIFKETTAVNPSIGSKSGKRQQCQ
jgi:beta-glucuronidase